jgi:hypothetical protein
MDEKQCFFHSFFFFFVQDSELLACSAGEREIYMRREEIASGLRY